VTRWLGIAGCVVTLITPTIQPLQGQTEGRATQVVTFSVVTPTRVDFAGTLLLRNSPQLTQGATSKVTVGVLHSDTLEVVVPHQTILPAGGATPLTPGPSAQPSRKSTVYTITE
jgi:hypothetical protein